MNEWIDELCDLAASGDPAVLVTVAGIRGSAPREVGAKMIVSRTQTIGTIGGGQLEYQSTRIATGLFEDPQMSLRSFPLGSSMGQCCGGVVEILFEPIIAGMPAWLRDLRALYGQREPAMLVTRISRSEPRKMVVTADQVYGDDSDTALAEKARRQLCEPNCSATRDVQEFFEPVTAPDLNIAVFGAGHVGTELVATLSRLDSNIRWIDSRRGIFRGIPGNVRAIEATEPALEVAAMPADSFYFVMTHSHALDFDITDRILRRGDMRYCGLIGSVAKRRRFEKRFRQQGMSPQQLARLTCPIGVDGITGKKPAEIAVAAAAELLTRYEADVQGRELPNNVRPIRG